MATHNSILGNINGKLGEVVGQSWMGKKVLRKYVSDVKNPRSDEQVVQRMRFGEVGRLSVELGEAIAIGMKSAGRAKGPMTAANLFMQLNLPNAEVSEEGAIEVDFSRLQLSQGSLPEVSFGAANFDGAGEISVGFEGRSESKGSDTSDEVYLTAYNPQDRVSVTAVGGRRGEQTATLKVPSRWSGQRVHLYGFVVGTTKDKNKGRVSRSSYLGSGMVG